MKFQLPICSCRITLVRSAAALAATLVLAMPAHAESLQSWDRIIDSLERFEVLEAFSGEAVLDKETGLVWEQQPHELSFDWRQAVQRCTLAPLGGRFGWRLPTVSELGSLLEPSNFDPALPTGHPFRLHPNLLQDHGVSTIWTSSSVRLAGKSNLWGISVKNADFGSLLTRANVARVWCVRGGVGVQG